MKLSDPRDKMQKAKRKKHLYWPVLFFLRAKRTVCFLLFAVCSLLLAACSQKGQEKFPSKPITVVCPPAPGGISDTITRTLSAVAEKEFGVPVLVENRTGGAGAVGMTYGAKAKPDGYTITYVVTEIAILPHLGLCPIRPEDFDLLFRTNYNPAALSVKADTPWKTPEDFAEHARRHPDEMRIANSGTASIWHLAALSLENEIGTRFRHIPYNGASEAVQALLGGHVDAVAVSPTEVQSGVESGQLKMLMVMAEARDANFPDIATAAEKGLNVIVGAWGGFGVPKDTPEGVKATIIAGYRKAFADPRFVDMMKKRSIPLAWLDSMEFDKFVHNQMEMFKGLIEKYHLRYE